MSTGEAPTLAAILFTDLVASTATRTRLGEERADALRKVHDTLVARCVEARRGRVIRGLGDGVLAVFPSASDALTAAVEAQQALVAYGARPDAIAPLPVRMGLSVGDVSWDGGDCFGTPLVEAARIMAVADGGQILCSDFVRAMARGRGGHTFADLGFLELKGLPEPLAVCEVQWEPAPDTGAAAQRPFPNDLVVHSALAFVGRDDELVTAARHLQADRFSCLWLIGEPGIGKTRLAAELARRAHAAGADVLTGRSDEDLVVPFQPFVTALRQYVRDTDPEQVGETLGRYPGELARLVPELTSVVSAGESHPAAQAEAERYRLFEAVRSWLAGAAGHRPVMLVLDDLHWADPATLGVLGHLARNAETVPLHVVGTVRDTEVSPELQGLLDELAGRPDSKVVPLAGLAEAGVSQLVEAAVDRAGGMAIDAAAVARRIHAETAGNPLFVGAVLSGLEQGEGPDGMPRDVVAAVRRRVVRLPAPAQELLRLGALCGLEFDSRVLSQSSGIALEAVLDQLDQAGQARLVEEAAAHRYRFAHAVVRDVLRQQIGPSRAAGHHRQIGEALEAVHHGRLDDHIAELAHHFGEAAAAGGPVETALRYLERAGQLAAARYAADAAAGHYRRIVELLDEAGQAGDHRHAATLVGLGESLWQAGRFDEALGVLRQAVVESEAGGWPELAAEAAIQFDYTALWTGIPGDEAAAMLGRAERSLPGGDTSLRARVLVSLGRAMSHTTRADDAVQVLDEAIAMARRLGDDAVLGRALLAVNQSLVGPRHLSRRARASDEAFGLVGRLGDHRLQRDVVITRGILQLELGAVDAIRALVDEAEALRREVPDPHWAYDDTNLASVAALLQGRIDDAERLAHQALQTGRALPGIDPDGVHGVQMFSLRRHQGRLWEVAPALATLARRGNLSAVWYPGLAALYTELEMADEARQALERLVEPDGVSLDHDSRRGLSLSYLAEAAAFVGDAARAAVLYRELEPYAGSWIAMHFVACQGPASRYLGLLAAVDPARQGDAVTHLEDALARSRAGPSPLWAAHAGYDLASVLLRRARPGDAARAEQLAADARAAAAQFGMAGLARRAGQLLPAG